MLDLLKYLLIPVLTFIFLAYIISYNTKIRSKGIKEVMSSQSAIYNKIKDFIPKNLINNLSVSQSQNHIHKYMLKVIVVDDAAYWIKDNMFYKAEIKDGSVLPDTAKQVDTSSMSKEDLDKMIFIVDKLRDIEQ